MIFIVDMQRRLLFMLLYGWFCLLGSCHSTPQTKVTVRVRTGQGRKIYIARIPNERERMVVIDSAMVEDMTKDIVFVIPREEERLYQLSFAGSGVKFIFINDSPELSIAGNYLTGKYEVRQSVASQELKQFLDHQSELAGRTRMLASRIGRQSAADHSRPKIDAPKAIDSLKKALDSTLIDLGKRYRSFADTVKSPAAFLLIYNNIEFANDYTGQEKFITAAAARFPSSPSIRALRDEVLAYIKVMKEEFQPGDLLPAITLPDREGRDFSTGSLKGKYYLIDFWSTWCPQCLAYNRGKQELRKLFPGGQFGGVSVAIDEEKQNWENSIRQQPSDWIQLIDTQMWRGVAVRTLKFDSIPFNFLVDPQGRILQKGLPPDSLVSAVTRAITHGR
jgi:thiol-disulfide isomerase/thioredoxin